MQPVQATTARSRQRLLREQNLLQLARQILLQEGFSGLTMDRLTAVSTVSKGTIYNHFSSKEDVLTALAIDSLQRLQALFTLAAQAGAHSRERVLALHYAYSLFGELQPTSFYCLINSASPAMQEKTSAARLTLRIQLEQRLMEQCEQLLQQACDEGALSAPQTSIARLAYLNWAVAFGMNALYVPGQQLWMAGNVSRSDICLQGLNLLFDGMGWQPLSNAWDYQQSWHSLAQRLEAPLTEIINKEWS